MAGATTVANAEVRIKVSFDFDTGSSPSLAALQQQWPALNGINRCAVLEIELQIYYLASRIPLRFEGFGNSFSNPCLPRDTCAPIHRNRHLMRPAGLTNGPME
jgi:hypothetical protein